MYGIIGELVTCMDDNASSSGVTSTEERPKQLAKYITQLRPDKDSENELN